MTANPHLTLPSPPQGGEGLRTQIAGIVHE